MKIIKKGEIPKKEYKETCNKCKTKFTYVNEDTQNDRDGKYVVCPTCESFIAVN